MARKKKQIEKKESHLSLAKRYLETAVDKRQSVSFNKTMGLVCEQLSFFSKENKLKSDGKIFHRFSKLFNSLAKQDTKTKAFISVFYDKEDLLTKEDKTAFRVQSIVDFSKYKGEECRVIHNLNGTIELGIGGLSLVVPKKYWKEFQEVKEK